MGPGWGTFHGPEPDHTLTIRAIDYTPSSVAEHALSGSEDVTSFAKSDTVTWINVDGLHDAAAIQDLGTRLDIHPLWIEDVLNPTCRPKAETGNEQVLVVSRAVRITAESTVDSEQITLIAGDGWVVTFQERPGDVWDPLRRRLTQGSGRIRSMKSDYLLHALLDVMVDHYFLVLEWYEDQVDAIEDRAITSPSGNLPVDFLRMKQELGGLRQTIWPMREALGSLLSAEEPPRTQETSIYFRDLYDHIVQVMDILDATRDRLTGVVELNLSLQGQRLNEIMKVLTLVSTIFIPLSFLAGLYGMNFTWMPELQIWWAYPALLALMATVILTMGWWFRKQKWF